MKDLEFAIKGYLVGNGCRSECGLDLTTTTGVFEQYYSDQGAEFTTSHDMFGSLGLATHHSRIVHPHISWYVPSE